MNMRWFSERRWNFIDLAFIAETVRRIGDGQYVLAGLTFVGGIIVSILAERRWGK